MWVHWPTNPSFRYFRSQDISCTQVAREKALTKDHRRVQKGSTGPLSLLRPASGAGGVRTVLVWLGSETDVDPVFTLIWVKSIPLDFSLHTSDDPLGRLTLCLGTSGSSVLTPSFTHRTSPRPSGRHWYSRRSGPYFTDEVQCLGPRLVRTS